VIADYFFKKDIPIYSSDNKFNINDGIVYEPILHLNVEMMRKRLEEIKNKNNVNREV